MAETIELTIPKQKYKVTIIVDLPDNELVKKYSGLFGIPKKEREYETRLKYDDKPLTDLMVKEKALEELFQNRFSLNQDYEKLSKEEELVQTLIKVTLLNNFYSTRINDSDLAAIARQIVELDTHARLKNSIKKEEPDCDLVNQIAYYRKDIDNSDDRINKAYSFASKYCSWHCHKYYPIVDSYVKGFLYYLNESLSANEQENNKVFIHYPDNTKRKEDKVKYFNDYRKYVDIYKSFKEIFNLTDTKQIDEYLWRYTKTDLTDENLQLIRKKDGKKINIDEYNQETKQKLKELADIVKLDNSSYYEELAD